MKITFSNLGNIKKTTLDLRPLTVIIGPNNSNKTYIAYSIYGLWKTINENIDTFPNNLNYKLESENTISLELDNIFFAEYSKLFSLFIEKFKQNLDVFFQDSSHKLFAKTNFELEINKNTLRETVDNIFSENEFEISDLKIKRERNQLIITRDDNLDSKNTSRGLEFKVITNVTWIISLSLFDKPILLPAERKAFIITYKMLANRRYKFLRESQRELFNNRYDQRQYELLKEQGDIRYPQPIEDFLDFLTDVELEKRIDGNSNPKRTIFYKIANKIEEAIQGSNRTNFKTTKFGGKEIKINVIKGLDIDLYNASSSIKQLTPLLLYLRYRVEQTDLLIIDEPEMNLHPEAQAKLLEVLGMLVNAGVKILLTTHSPYFMSHLNNLIAGDMSDEKTLKQQAKSLYLQDERAFLSPDDVSAYEMRKDRAGYQKLHDLKDKDYGIRWDTLSDVSAEIQQKFFEIYEKGDKSSNGEEE